MPHPSVANVLSVLFMDVDPDAAIIGLPKRHNPPFRFRAARAKYSNSTPGLAREPGLGAVGP